MVEEARTINPVVIDLGKVRRKRIKDLKRGRGKLLWEVDAAVEQVRAGLGDEGSDKTLVPIVVCYQKKRRGGQRRRRRGRDDLSFLC